MDRKITFHPITRIEGHAKVTIMLGEGEVKDAYFQVLEYRGFERFLRRRPIEEIPMITPRICGLCSTSHHIASVKAVDRIFGVEPPIQAEKLRKLLHYAGLLHSHILHFFILYMPDILLKDLPPERRGFPELLKRYSNLVKEILKVRRFSRKVLEELGSSSIHATPAIPGGFSKPISHEKRVELLREGRENLGRFIEIISEKAIFIDGILDVDINIPSNFISLYSKGETPFYNSKIIRAVSSSGELIEDFQPEKYMEIIGEHVVPYSYAKAPYIKKLGYPKGAYRVGPLARNNINGRLSTDMAAEFQEKMGLITGKPLTNPRYYNLARIAECIYALERIIQILEDEGIENFKNNIPEGKIVNREAVGVVEAPRGTLIHHFKVDGEGSVEEADLIVATVQNTPIIGVEIKEIAEKIMGKDDENFEVKLFQEISRLIRDYDPCLSCATHIPGFPLKVEIRSERGEIISEIPRGLGETGKL